MTFHALFLFRLQEILFRFNEKILCRFKEKIFHFYGMLFRFNKILFRNYDFFSFLRNTLQLS